MPLRIFPRLVIAASLVVVGSLPTASGQVPAAEKPTGTGVIQVDPLLVGQIDQVWKVIGGPKNPVWPGWNAGKTPVLVYLPNRQDLLLNHPKPPDGFRPYTGSVKSALGSILLRDGPGEITSDGQNTAIEVNGVRTLVVADTLSRRRQQLQGVIGSADTSKGIEAAVTPNPLDTLGLIAHEAFHVYQYSRAATKAPDEMALAVYPALSVENNVWLALEADCLHAALAAKTRQEAVPHLEKWLAARTIRRQGLPKAAVAYEDATEFMEGTAKYVEYRLTQCLEAVEPLDGMWLVQGFKGFKDLSVERAAMRMTMRRMMSGDAPVNNDPYGASPVRFRLYYSGMALGAALDVLGVAWHDRAFEPGVTLTSLLQAELGLSPKQLESAAAELRAGERYSELVKRKKVLEEEGEAYVRKVMDGFDRAAGTLIIDYSKSGAKLGLTYTSFGILRVTDERTVFRLVPLRGTLGGFQFAEDAARPALQDTKAKQIRVQLTGKPDASDLSKQLGAEVKDGGRVRAAELKLPGVTLRGVNGVVRLDGGQMTLLLEE